jgi:hypothetical protein
MPSVGVLLLERSPEHRRGADSAAFQIADVTTSALTVGVVGILVSATTTSLLALPVAVFASVAVLTLLALLGALVAPRAGAAVAAPGLPDGAATLAPS